ncbi:MAG: outer membrane protein assembly factor BamB family protein [Planctomycetota bacterium]|jgi:outer membrane protein assembly factor BamB
MLTGRRHFFQLSAAFGLCTLCVFAGCEATRPPVSPAGADAAKTSPAKPAPEAPPTSDESEKPEQTKEPPRPDAEALAREILAATGVRGGLVVHVGCGDGKLTAALRAGDAYLLHGLAVDTDDVEKARAHVRSLDLYGKVSVTEWSGKRLPYADGLVNLLVAEGAGRVSAPEIMRVLAPRGVAYVKGAGAAWTKTVKPWPDGIDEWTHHLHDAGGNAVARDRVVGPPRHLRWTAGPLWARSHGWSPSVTAMVSARGRLFYICDETLTCVDGTVPDRWFLTARDAFSGVVLWKRPVPAWGSKDMSGVPGTGHGFTNGRFSMPLHAGKRLVAVGDTVYVTLGAAAPVTALDAATGEERRVYPETARAEEVLYDGGRLFVSVNPADGERPPTPERGKPPAPAPGKRVLAIEADTGRVLWKAGPFTGVRASKGQDPFGRLELAAGDGRVFVLTPEAIRCLAADSGEESWRIDRPAIPEKAVRRVGFAGMYEFLLEVMVYRDGVVLLAQPEPNTHHTYHTMPGTLYAFDAADGRQMWKRPYGGWGHCTQPDLFVAGDSVWTHVNAETEFGSVWGKGFKAKSSDKVDYRIQELDLKTGKLRKELPTKEIFNVGHHHRCYRNRSTERYLMSSRRGVEFVDLASGENWQNHWVRSGCILGNLPANGLLYVAPHPCGCYITAKLTGFNALAAVTADGAAERSDDERLHRGPAYGKFAPAAPGPEDAEDWPTHRHDALRSGATESAVGAKLTEEWRATVGARPSGIVVAGGVALVADVDSHTVHALDPSDGRRLWAFTAGARVDSPPTFHEGLAIFGSADGRVYCLRASDGKLVWRFDAAPRVRRVAAFGQLESAWPVPGSVLVHEGKCWFAAGRSSYLDGGIRIWALDPATGEVAERKTVYSPDPETGKMTPVTSQNAMPGVLNDVLGTDGSNVFMRQMQVTSADSRGGRHLYSTAGFLDSSWFNRTFWKVGPAQTSGVMVLGKDVAYGVEVYASRSRETVFKPGSGAYRVGCFPLKRRAEKGTRTKGRSKGPPARWEVRVPIRVTAMVRAGDTLFAAGSPDAVDPEDPHGAWEGRRGGTLVVLSAADGGKLSEVKLPAPPVWDGMAAARGKLYIALMNGDIICLRGDGQPQGR